MSLLALANNREPTLVGSPLTEIILDAGPQKDLSKFSSEEEESFSSTKDENSIQNNIFITPRNNIDNLQEENDSISTVLDKSRQRARNKTTNWSKDNQNELTQDQSETVGHAIKSMTDA